MQNWGLAANSCPVSLQLLRYYDVELSATNYKQSGVRERALLADSVYMMEKNTCVLVQ